MRIMTKPAHPKDMDKGRPAGPAAGVLHDADDFAAILAAAVDGIVIINDHGVVEVFNPAAEQMFGYRAEEIVGRNVSELMPSSYRPGHDGAIGEYLETRQPKVVGIGRETVGQRKDGTVFPIYLAMSEARRGRHSRFVGIVRDLTEQKKLERAIVTVGEDVRRDIGREIHDVLGQQLTTISLLAKTIQKESATATEIGRMASAAMLEARRLAHGLYPAALERHGLCAALEELAESYRHFSKMNCAYEGLATEPELPAPAKLHLYRIAQEAVSNAVRHSGAGRIVIRFVEGRHGLDLRIEDDGCGMTAPPETREGIGLKLMKYRAGMVGGELSIVSGRSGGVTVSCRLPRAGKMVDPDARRVV
jgi:two-component system CheB/CheR fusion protein